MSRTRAQALALVNWRGVFYERYLVDRHVTALEGANGAGKTTVMIAAYVVLLPDMSRLRFTNLGETGATGGDKGIWGRLGESGRPSYAAADFLVAPDQRLVAGVHLERKGEPTVEPTPFVITGLASEARLQDVLLLAQGEQELVPELSELRENVARAGGRLQVFSTARDYFAALFEHGVTPLRLGTDEERNKLNEMLRTSMTGGISRTLTSELRSFLLKEERGLANTLQRMKANLDACRRTRTEVQESQRLEREIGGVFESGQSMFAAAYLATRERADERRRRLAEAEHVLLEARKRRAEADDLLARVDALLDSRGTRQEALTRELEAAEEGLRRLEQALEAAREVARRRDELSTAEAEEGKAAERRAGRHAMQERSREAVRRCRDDHKRASAGLADLQRGLDELHRRAAAYRQVVRRKREAERLLGVADLPVDAIEEERAENQAELERVDGERRRSKQRIADAREHRREHAVALEALARLADATVDPKDAHGIALERLRRFRDLQALSERRERIATELYEARKLALRQAEAHSRLEALDLSLSGTRPAQLELAEHLEETERERERLLDGEREALSDAAACRGDLEGLRARQEELGERRPVWLDLAARAERLAEQLGRPVTSMEELREARELVARRLTTVEADQASLTEERERLHTEARELLSAGGPFHPELLRLKDALGAELLASVFEDVSLEDASILEARLGPLVRALVVDDPAVAARQIRDRPASLDEVWLVGRDDDAVGPDLVEGPDAVEQTDIVVPGDRATRVTRIPTRPRLGRRAREQRAVELREEASTLDTRIESSRTERRGLERLREDGETLLASQSIWAEGDPEPELAVLRRRLMEVQAQEQTLREEARRHREIAETLALRLRALRALLGNAVLLDPPDHACRRDLLEEEHETALAAQAETRRSADAARVVEDALDALRRTPLSEDDVADLEAELTRLSDERERLDAAIEAMEAVETHVEALAWDDASERLEEHQSLVPALEEQLRRAERALDEAESAAEIAQEEYERATAEWQDADGRRRAVVAGLATAERDLDALGVADPSEAKVKDARREREHLKEEARSLKAELDALNTRKGRCEAEKAQADRETDLAEERVGVEGREAAPALERWDRLREAVEEHGLLASLNAPGNRAVSEMRGHVNLVQEAHKQKAVLVERLRAARGAQELLARVDRDPEGADLAFADVYLDLWLAVRDWLRRRLPAQVADVDDPREALLRLRDQLTGLEERLTRQEDDLRGASEDVARGIDVQIRKARGQIQRLNRNLDDVRFGSIGGIRVKLQPVERMERVLRSLREGAVQGLLFQENLPIEEALDEIFRRYGGGRSGGPRLLDYREYVHLQVEIRRRADADWEIANPTRLSTGEAIGVGAALMMVVLTEWERDANILRGNRAMGSLRFLFLDEANRLSHDNLGVLFDLCRTLDLQLLIAAPEVARADGNTTYRLVRRVDEDGREEVLVSGRRTRTEA